MKKKELGFCNFCKENSVVTKVYTRRGGKKCRVLYCLNKGCGYREELPFPEDYELAKI